MEADWADSACNGHVAWRDGQVWLSAQAQMLVNMRDMLYEGDWGDFETDLKDRMAGRPHVFDIVAPSSEMIETIRLHLVMIQALQKWERKHEIVLEARPPER